MNTGWNLSHTYSSLPEIFFSKLSPVPVAAPRIVILNRPLALSLGLDPDQLQAEMLSGNGLPPGANSIAQAYAGHQYGHFTMLGDGRAILLGEQVDPQGHRWDIQLKGSGRTPYSRGGDGRAALGPMLREYLISEAMHALGIPTTRSLAVVTTGEPVYRELPLPGAILTRVAASHIRVGTFEYAAGNGPEFVRQLADYVIQRHYPEVQSSKDPYLSLLQAIACRQASLIAKWMTIGFVHGVMNTDNMAVSGQTIDYGPCAFMDRYDPATVFSSIDRHGRYAYGNQPAIAQWNLTRLAETLVPLLDQNAETAVEIAKEVLAGFEDQFSDHFRQGMRAKLGLFESHPDDESLIEDLFGWMLKAEADFTHTFRALTLGQSPMQGCENKTQTDPAWSEWSLRLQRRRESESRTPEDIRALMRRSNPNLIPRNHHVEAVLSAATEKTDLAPLLNFLTALQDPFENHAIHRPYLEPAPKSDDRYRTFCGT